jgi:hypothetical protein
VRVGGGGGPGRDSSPGEWSGSNVDLGTFSEVDEDLRLRVVRMDEAMAEAEAANRDLRESMGSYMVAYARSISLSNEKTNAAREREAKTDNVELRVEMERAELRWKFAQMAVRAAESQLNGVQSRGANLRSQLRLDGTAPSYGTRDDKVPF